jgi:serine/threonine-protein kinase
VNVARFRREIELAAALQHPHIIPLLSAGESAGVLYYTMPYVQGETLRARLIRGGELSVAEAVRVLREMADALAYAHAEGVVHRDIKPENILLSGSARGSAGAWHALAADFGVAKALAAATSAEGGLTSTGVVLGTPAYMAPEQAAGDPGTDQRADLYALGVVAYETLTGQAPFAGRPSQALLAAHATEPPEPITTRRPSLPAGLAALVMRLLEKRPADRPQSAEEVLRELEAITSPSAGGTAAAPAAPAAPAAARTAPRRTQRRLLPWAAGAVVLLAAVGTSAYWRWGRGERGRAETARPVTGAPSAVQSVAVLPLVNVGNDTATEYFTDGMTEELIGALAKVPGLQVAARTSSFAFKGKRLSVRTIGDSLKVGAVVEGSVRRSGQRLRVSAELVSVTTGYQLWAESYDRELTEVFQLQDELARAIVSALQVKLIGPGEAPLVRQATRSPAAHDLYLQGRSFWNQRTAGALRTAVRYFERAIALDSSYAEAYAGLAQAYVLFPNYDVSNYDVSLPREAYPKAEAAALRALALDSTLAEAHAALAVGKRNYEWDWPGAEREFRRALALDPSDATAHSWYAGYLSATGRHAEALAEIDRALALDPLSRVISVVKGLVLYNWSSPGLMDTEFRPRA